MLSWLVQYGLLTGLCIYLVRYYSSKQVSIHVKIWSVITWVLNFGLALLIPQDVFLTISDIKYQQQTKSLGVHYLILYWSVYLLTWTIIPVLQEWQDAGDLQSKDRLKRSLKSNGIFYLWLIVGAIVGLIVLILLNAGGQMGLITFLKCLATMWGMLLLMILLGYSLVEVPKTMWRNAQPEDYLIYLYQKIAEVEQDVNEAKSQFRNIISYISYVKKSSNDPQILKYCSVAEDKVPIYLKNAVKVSKNKNDSFATTDFYLNSYPINLQNTIQHNRLMKRAIALYRRQTKTYQKYILEAIFYQDIKQAKSKGIPLYSKIKKLNPLSKIWYVKVRHVFNKVGSVFITICGICILISQTQVFIMSHSLMGGLLSLGGPNVVKIATFFVVGFIVYMSNYALFRLKLANLYGLYHKQSDGASLMFATVNFSRIGVAIVLNFFDMIKLKGSVYQNVMGAPQMGLLGDWVLRGLPGVLWLIVLAHYFNFWGWIANKIGFDNSYSFSSHQIKQGKIQSPPIVQQRRKQYQQQYSNGILQQFQD